MYHESEHILVSSKVSLLCSQAMDESAPVVCSYADSTSLQTLLYSPLSQDPPEVRLLQVGHSDDWDAPVECTFHTVPLEGQIDFAALSYVWGNPEITQAIKVNGQLFPATINLVSGLRHIRERAKHEKLEGSMFWIDAICTSSTACMADDINI